VRSKFTFHDLTWITGNQELGRSLSRRIGGGGGFRQERVAITWLPYNSEREKPKGSKMSYACNFWGLHESGRTTQKRNEKE